MGNVYSLRGAERKLPAHDAKPDYFGIRLIRYKGQRCFLSTRRELFPFTEEKDRIPAWRSARAHAAWPRPDWLDETDSAFIDTRNGKQFPFKPDEPLHRRFILDSILWAAAHQRKEDAPAIPAAENEQRGEKEIEK